MLSNQDDSDTEFDGWVEDADESQSCRSLFDPTCELPSVRAVISDSLANYGFDLKKCAHSVGTDDITLIKLVNFIRIRVKEALETQNSGIDKTFTSALQNEITSVNSDILLAEDKYMFPVIPNDPILYLLADEMELDLGGEEDNIDYQNNVFRASSNSGSSTGLKEGNEKSAYGGTSKETSTDKTLSNIMQLHEELNRARSIIGELNSSQYMSPVKSSQTAQNQKESLSSPSNSPQLQYNEKDGSLSGKKSGGEDDGPADDSYYFDSYALLSIHETMLRDSSRTLAYQAALLDNPDSLRGKVVLDVGCGTGILSMFAAKAGASKVIGVDLSDIINKSRKVVTTNDLGHVVTLIKGKMESVLLPLQEGEVDIIVSEWMGYGLYFENMLPSVMYARDKYLKKEGGVIMPSSASLYIEPLSTVEDLDDRVSFWSDVYGFNLTEFENMLIQEAQVQHVKPEQIIGSRYECHMLDIYTATDADLDFHCVFSLTIDTKKKKDILKAFVISFDVLFAGPKGGSSFNNKALSTSVQTESTHWKQTVLWLKPEHRFEVTKGAIITGKLAYQRSSKNPRDYDVVLTFTNPVTNEEQTQLWALA